MTSSDRTTKGAAVGLALGCIALFVAAIAQSQHPVLTAGSTLGSFALGLAAGVLLLRIVGKLPALRQLWLRPATPVLILGTGAAVVLAGAEGPDSEFAIFFLMGFAISVLVRTRRLLADVARE